MSTVLCVSLEKALLSVLPFSKLRCTVFSTAVQTSNLSFSFFTLLFCFPISLIHYLNADALKSETKML